jgi:conjugal transfer/type IV secretion protein DotA/TraY
MSGASDSLTFKGAFGFFFNPVRFVGPGLHGLFWVHRVFVRAIAITFINAGLLPPDHIAAKKASIFSNELKFEDVMSEAWSRIHWKNYPQLLVYFSVWGVLACLALGMIFGALRGMVGTAWAQSAAQQAVNSLTNNTDLSLAWFGNTFGLANGSISQTQTALGQMLAVYNGAALSLGTFLFLYNIGVFVTESGHHGVVGGKRHSALWGPVRMVAGIGLLVPLPSGWNAGEAAVLQIAAQGSVYASQVWTAYTSFVGNGKGAIVNPMIPNAEKVIGTALTIETCMAAFNTMAANAGDSPYIAVNVNQTLSLPAPSTNVGGSESTSVVVAVERSYDGAKFYVRKVCGAMRFVPPGNFSEAGASAMVAAHRDAFMAVLPSIQTLAAQIVAANTGDPANRPPLPSTQVLQSIVSNYSQQIVAAVPGAVAQQNGELQAEMAAQTATAGWAAAPAWFGTISRLNGQIAAAAADVPEMVGPAAQSTWPSEVLTPIGSAIEFWHSTLSDLGRPNFESTAAGTEDGFFDHLLSKFGGFGDLTAQFLMTSTDPFAETIAFGHHVMDAGLALILFMAAAAAAAASPGFAAVAGTAAGGPGGGLAALAGSVFMGSGIATALTFLSNFLSYMSMGLIVGGGLLAVVLPFLPLIRWLFGCVSWLLSVFEAVVAVPVLLIAHLRMDGEGFAGPSAQSGYTLLLGLALRPILMVLSLVISLLIFNSVVQLLNVLWLPTLKSVQSGNAHGLIVATMQVVLYCTTVYGIANASLKSIDHLPNQILKWIGGAVMQDMDGSQSVTQTTTQAGRQLAEGTSKGATAATSVMSGGGKKGGETGEGTKESERTTDQMLSRDGEI